MSKGGCCSAVAREESINRFLKAWCWLASKEVLFSGKGSTKGKGFLSEGGQTKPRKMLRIFVGTGQERNLVFLHVGDGCYGE